MKRSKEIRQDFLDFFASKKHKIVPSAPVIPYDDPTLLFINAGMNQFKDVFLGTGKRDYKRCADTQKCIRVSGKHNDLDEVGHDGYHHTFFEMLGNWSFGDYYKKEAIAWAWELITGIWKLDKNRLWVTVFRDDEEALNLWKTETDIDHSHILKFDEKDNFWEMGDTGPCGPCSEIHYDFTETGCKASDVNADNPDVMEFWNLVFIQYNRDAEGKLHELPQKHIDTGMGFERMVRILQKKTSNYLTDVFLPLINELITITGKEYSGKYEASINVVADHVRTLTFAIGDGVIPSNDGRGYVLRRVLRRAARYGRNLDMRTPFIYKLVDTLVETMGHVFPEIVEKKEFIKEVIKGEEESFNVTLDRGIKIFNRSILETFHRKLRDIGYYTTIEIDTNVGEEYIDLARLTDTSKKLIEKYYKETKQFAHPAKLMDFIDLGRIYIDHINPEIVLRLIGEFPILSGNEVFLLHDTFGFPVDLTELMAKEKGFKIDMDRFVELMNEQKIRARTAREENKFEIRNPIENEILNAKYKTEYDPYEIDANGIETEVLNSNKAFEGEYEILYCTYLKKNPFYAESGGQVADRGWLKVDNKITLDVVDSKKDYIYVKNNEQIDLNDKLVTALVEFPRRNYIEQNHSATHIVHEALRRVLGNHIEQKGSLVTENYLRFDFPHFQKLTNEEIKAVENIVNEKITESIEVETKIMKIDEAERNYPNLRRFFGDKYGEIVRVVIIDKKFSVELCGGTHVKNTKEIGFLKVTKEESIATGTRRIFALTGISNVRHIQNLLKEIDLSLIELPSKYTLEISEDVQSFKMDLDQVKFNELQKLEDYYSNLETLAKKVEGIKVKYVDDKKAQDKTRQRETLESVFHKIDLNINNEILTSEFNFPVLTSSYDDVLDNKDQLKEIGNYYSNKLPDGTSLSIFKVHGNLNLLCHVSGSLVKTTSLTANALVSEVAQQFGGKGGGKPTFAIAGINDNVNADEVFDAFRNKIKEKLKF